MRCWAGFAFVFLQLVPPSNLRILPKANVTELINIDGTETFGDVWNDGGGGGANHTAGNIEFTGEQGILSTVDVGTGATDDLWLRFKLDEAAEGNMGPAFGDSSGNLQGVILDVGAGSLVTDNETQYTTYTTWVGDTSTGGQNYGTSSAANVIGVTMDVSLRVFRLWNGVTADTPDSLTSWDSAAADGSFTLSRIDRGRVGLICWTGTPGTQGFEFFVAGDFAAVGANPKGPLGMPLHGPFGGPI